MIKLKGSEILEIIRNAIIDGNAPASDVGDELVFDVSKVERVTVECKFRVCVTVIPLKEDGTPDVAPEANAASV